MNDKQEYFIPVPTLTARQHNELSRQRQRLSLYYWQPDPDYSSELSTMSDKERTLRESLKGVWTEKKLNKFIESVRASLR